MGNAPLISFSARNNPPEIEERYNRWYDAAYAPLYTRKGFCKGIDRYKIIRKSYTLPLEIAFYHYLNFDDRLKAVADSDRNAALRDSLITFNKAERFWYKSYELIGSFQSGPSPQRTVGSTIVDNCPIIHFEGYKIPAAETGKFESWFNKWATRVLIPLILKIPGVRACNFFSLLDYDDPSFRDVRFIETEMPHYLSIIYFEKPEFIDIFNQSIELAAFRGDMEMGFGDALKIVWNTEYQLFASYRPKPNA